MRTRKILLYFSEMEIIPEMEQEISKTLDEPLLREDELIKPFFCKSKRGIYVIRNLKTFEKIKKYNILKLLILVPHSDLNTFITANFVSNKIDILPVKTLADIPSLIKNYVKNFNNYVEHITFMKICEAYEFKGACLSRSVGVVIIKDNKIISGSENNTSGRLSCLKLECNYCNKKSKNISECICVHAETNALLDIRVPINNETTIYSTTFPCYACTLQIISSGIKRVIFRDFYKDDTKRQSIELFKVNSVKCSKLERLDDFPGYNLIDIV